MVKKRYVYLLLVFLGILCMFLLWNNNSDKETKLERVKLNNKEDAGSKELFAIMLGDEEGNYTESTSNSWPNDGSYFYNEEKSNCLDINGKIINDVLSFDSLNYTITVSTDTTIYCYLYFDSKLPDDLTINITTNGTSSAIPTDNGYKRNVSCDKSTYIWNEKYQRIEFSSLTTNTRCTLNYEQEDTSNYTLLSDVVKNANSTDNNGYRYTGKQPNNYIWFNNELWRIIGLVPVCTSASSGTCNTRNSLVKIMRAESIGGLAFNNSASNTIWGTNTLSDLLNKYYYGKLNGTSSDECYSYYYSSTISMQIVCDYRANGISKSSTDYYGKMIEGVYWDVGTISELSTTIANGYSLEIATVSSNKLKIGLVNVSDYGFASGQSTIALSSVRQYSSNNWMHWNGSMSTIIPYSNTQIIVLDNYYNNLTYQSSNRSNKIYPTLYLNSEVYKLNGTGTILNPYIIGI